MLTVNTAHNKYTKAIAALLVLSTAILLQGCHHNTGATTIASHKVKLDRHGPTNRFGVEDRGQLAIFRYDGYNGSGTRLRVTIDKDKLMINDKDAGILKQGDSVQIGDDGLTVNSLDYGQTAKYLEASLKQETSQNISQ